MSLRLARKVLSNALPGTAVFALHACVRCSACFNELPPVSQLMLQLYKQLHLKDYVAVAVAGINLQMEQWEALVGAAAGIESALAALGPAASEADSVKAEAVKTESVKAEGEAGQRALMRLACLASTALTEMGMLR